MSLGLFGSQLFALFFDIRECRICKMLRQKLQMYVHKWMVRGGAVRGRGGEEDNGNDLHYVPMSHVLSTFNHLFCQIHFPRLVPSKMPFLGKFGPILSDLLSYWICRRTDRIIFQSFQTIQFIHPDPPMGTIHLPM